VEEPSSAERLRLAIEMFDFGMLMQRTRLRREHPEAAESAIDLAVQEWLLSRPGAPLGDAIGRPSARFA
jgi:hypothetical protein